MNDCGIETIGAVRAITCAPSPVPAAVVARRRNVMPPFWFVIPVTVYDVADAGIAPSNTVDGVQPVEVQ